MGDFGQNDLDDFFPLGGKEPFVEEVDEVKESRGIRGRLDDFLLAIERNTPDMTVAALIIALVCVYIGRIDKDNLLEFRAVPAFKRGLVLKGVESVSEIGKLTSFDIFRTHGNTFGSVADSGVGLVNMVGVEYPTDFTRTAKMAIKDLCAEVEGQIGMCAVPGVCEEQAMSALVAVANSGGMEELSTK